MSRCQYFRFVILLLLAILDRLTKYLVLSGKTMTWGFLNWSLIINDTFWNITIPPTITIIFSIGILLIIGILYWMFYQQKKYCYLLPLSLIIIGGVSNLIDRCYWGGVIDFITLTNLLVFNLADIYLIVGLIWLIKNTYTSCYVR